MNTLFIGLDFALIFLKAHSCFLKLIHGRFDIVHDKVENREGCRTVIGFGINKYALAADVYI